MTDQELEERLRAWYRAEVDLGEVASLRLQQRVGAIPATGRRTAHAGRRRNLVLLLAAAVATTALVGSYVAGGRSTVPVIAVATDTPTPSGSISATPGPVTPAPASPSPTKDSASPQPSLPLGGGLILSYEPHQPAGSCNTSYAPFDVFTIDPASGIRTLLGTTADDCRLKELSFQWARDRVHVLMADHYRERPVTLETFTAAASNLRFICCALPTDVWQGAHGGDDGWVLSPLGDRAAAIHTSGTGVADGVVVANTDGTDRLTLLLPPGADARASGALSWAPDQSAVLVSACLPCNHQGPNEPATENDQHVFIVPTDGSTVRDLLHDGNGSLGFPAWSPDGSLVAVVTSDCASGETIPYCYSPRRSELDLVTVADGRVQKVLGSDRVGGEFTQILSPSWSRDGARLAFTADTGDSFTIAADGSDLAPLGTGSVVQWSPDGEWLAVARRTADESVTALWIMHADGTDARQVMTFPAFTPGPAW
jgi:hypothetical protein